MKREHAYKLREMLHKASSSLSDTDALEAVELFPRWEHGTAYRIDQRIRFGDKLYRVIQAHTSQLGWEPPVVPALFTEIAMYGIIPVWKQPISAQDAYRKGDTVHYPTATGPIYISLYDNNAWEPSQFGWDLMESAAHTS